METKTQPTGEPVGAEAELATVSFYARHPGLQSFDRKCRATVRAVRKLESLGFLRVSWSTSQAEHTGKVFAP